MRELLWIIALLVLGYLPAAAHGGENIVSAKICYIPLGTETYVPMTISNIDTHCSYIGDLDLHDKKYLDIRALISKAGPGSFEDGLVRVKIAVPGADCVYIDNHGGVKIGEAKYQLDASSLLKIRKIVEKASVARTK